MQGLNWGNLTTSTGCGSGRLISFTAPSWCGQAITEHQSGMQGLILTQILTTHGLHLMNFTLHGEHTQLLQVGNIL